MPNPRSVRLVGLLVLPLLFIGPFSLMWIPEHTLVSGDALATTQALQDHADLFRLGLLGEALIAFTEVGMVVALYQLFRQAGESLSIMAALARSIMVALMGTSIIAGITALSLGQATPDLVLALMEWRGAVQSVWETFFAMHLLLLAPLVYRSGLVPKLFGPLLFTAGLGYALNGLGGLALPAIAPITEQVVAVTAMLGEVPLFLWLLAKGVSGAAPTSTRTEVAHAIA